jgi:hypothetical protein
MKLDDDEPREHDFSSDKEMPNIWALHDEDEGKDNGKKADAKLDEDKAHEADEDEKDSEVVTSDLEDDLEKPSFLRRLGRRKKNAEEDEVKATSDTDDDQNS